MTFGASLFLIAVGAILRFAVDDRHPGGVSLWAVGVILMIVGAVGFLISLVLVTARRRTDVIARRDGATYIEPSPLDPRL